jgi:hypothetical protein
MRIAWFTHRYYPCIGGAETFGRSMVRRFVAGGDQVDVFTSDAHDLWYFTDRSRRRLDAPRESCVDGARVRRFAIRHIPLQRYVGRLLSYAPHWPTRCQVSSYMPIIPGIGRVRGDYDAVCAVGFPYTLFSYAALRTARAAGAPLILVPFLHLATPGDKVNRHYTRPHQIRLLAEAQTVVVVTRLEAEAVAGWGIPRDRIFQLGMAVDHAEVTGGLGNRLRNRLGIPHDRKVVGHLATLDPNKGTNDLVLAIDRLNALRPAARPDRADPGGGQFAPLRGVRGPLARLDPPLADPGRPAVAAGEGRLLRGDRRLRHALADRLLRHRLPGGLGQRQAGRRRRRRRRRRGRGARPHGLLVPFGDPSLSHISPSITIILPLIFFFFPHNKKQH